MDPVIVKLGGSLLNNAATVERVRCWLATKRNRETKVERETNVEATSNYAPSWLVVVGGGEEVNRLRDQFPSATSNDEVLHWRAIEIMSHNARQISSQFDVPLVDSVASVSDSANGASSKECDSVRIFDPLHWLRTTWQGPCDWSVTSDSIAVALATAIGCEAVILLKSSLNGLNARCSIEQLCASGIVDAYFREAANQYVAAVPEASIQIVNMRDDAMPEVDIALN